ncbi:ADP-ribosylglycohydrolase family protein [Paenibacillus cymbidii]|uniref:ADP-ribosylglycohydrolase family protein n=1 Tax=Paenibacillus cymbidii TaxID=1639034 RepID=UPI001080CE9A|nr:ADP-ribosylglycohydrolase family protein [Paenibacillus cymbidii]
MAGWAPLRDLVREEIQQRSEEGCDVQGFVERVEAAGNDDQQLLQLYEQLMALPVRGDFAYEEPSELTDIRRLRPEGPRRLSAAHSEEVWRDKFYGAWLGRSVGCALGKPVENSHFMRGSFGNPGWRNVQLWFEGADAWPIRGYTPEFSRAEQEVGIKVNKTHSLRERIEHMETDDDIRYTVLGLLMLEERGLDWDSWHIGKMWHRLLTYGQVCTAETQAYLNFTQATSHIHGQKPDDWESRKDWVRTHLNPYREWIGAQIRADGFAYGAAGNPELAADLAWRDASFSHVKNGIYGEMFVAAMIAAAFVESDPERIVAIGLSEIPRGCRLAHDIALAVEIAKQANDQVELVDRIWEAFKHYDPVHTNNNAALVAAALVFARGDFELAVTTAVLGGWDTDCNGATVGSIMGAALGAAALPASWTEPLHDTLYAEVSGFHPIAISACAERSYQVFRKLAH